MNADLGPVYGFSNITVALNWRIGIKKRKEKGQRSQKSLGQEKEEEICERVSKC